MKLKQVEVHRSFGGYQYKYSHYSEVLNCEMQFSLYLPDCEADRKIDLIWWLSGLTCTDDNFTQKSGFQRLAQAHQVAIIMPDTSPRGEGVADDANWDLGQGAGFYVNATQEPWAKNYKMYDYIVNELTTIVRTLIPHFSGKESIMGHSMGGHGALVIGMKNPERFCAISAFAPILSPSHVPWGIHAFTNYLGDNQACWQEWDATGLAATEVRTPILITQGTEDNFYTRELKEDRFLENAQKYNLNVQYQQVEGYDHSYFFIATFLEEHFAFHRTYLK